MRACSLRATTTRWRTRLASAEPSSTSDRDFFPIADDLMAREAPFLGMFFIQPRATVGDAVRIIAEAALSLEPSVMANRIEWASLSPPPPGLSPPPPAAWQGPSTTQGCP